MRSYLARAATGHSNDDRVVYVSDTLPRTVTPGSTHVVNFTVRNNGWNTLTTSAATPLTSRVTMHASLMLDMMGAAANTTATCTTDVVVGGSGTFTGTVTAPPSAKPGATLTFAYGLVRGSDVASGSFVQRDNPAYVVGVSVVAGA